MASSALSSPKRSGGLLLVAGSASEGLWDGAEWIPQPDPVPHLCQVCFQEPVAFDAAGLGWCLTHASTQLLSPDV